MAHIARWINELDHAARKSARYSDSDFVLLGWLSWLYPLATLADIWVANPTFGTFALRLSVALVSLPLIPHRKLPLLFQKYFYLYFVFLMAYCFPFVFGLMMVMNAATTPPGTQSHMFWILQYFIALFLFLQLVVDGKLATVLWVFASVGALFPLTLIDQPNLVELERILVYPITGYMTALLIGIATNRRTDIVNAEKTAAASAIGANLAHELRTPLASIGATANGARNLFPTLTDAYRKAKRAGLPVEPLRVSQLDYLDEALAAIQNEVEYSNTVIDMLLLNTADKPISTLETHVFDAGTAIAEALERFPFNNAREKQLVQLEESESFLIRGNRVLFVHIVFNLIKNGIHFVQRAGKGRVTISMNSNTRIGEVLVHDTGTGIPPSVLPHIFERFYTTTPTSQSAGIGLSFCKLVVESMNGQISCDSKEGEYTTFTLTFPIVTDETLDSRSGPECPDSEAGVQPR